MGFFGGGSAKILLLFTSKEKMTTDDQFVNFTHISMKSAKQRHMYLRQADKTHANKRRQ